MATAAAVEISPNCKRRAGYINRGRRRIYKKWGDCQKCHLPRKLVRRHPKTDTRICLECYKEILGLKTRQRRVGQRQKPNGRCAECRHRRWLNRRHPDSWKRICKSCYDELTGKIKQRAKKIRHPVVKKLAKKRERLVVRQCASCPTRSVFVQHRLPGESGHFCQKCHRKKTGWKRAKQFCFRCERLRRCDYPDWQFQVRICWRCNKDHKKLEKVA